MKLCWYMRGGMTLDEGFCLSYEDRQLINDIIKDNLETTKKTQMPFFQACGFILTLGFDDGAGCALAAGFLALAEMSFSRAASKRLFSFILS